MATQNPIEYEGTFPLPEAQLDRFMLNISLGYPAPADEVTILDRQQRSHPIDSLGQILTADELTAMQRQIPKSRVDPENPRVYRLAGHRDTATPERLSWRQPARLAGALPCVSGSMPR